MEAWSDFFVAEAGAAAALAGLLFVAVSINLPRVLAIPHLPTRAIESLTALVSVLFVATCGLIPEQTLAAYGWEIGGVGVVALTIQTVSFANTSHVSRQHGRLVAHLIMNQAPPLPFVIAGGLMIFGYDVGAYWIAPGVLLSFLSGILGAWVLLVEIQR